MNCDKVSAKHSDWSFASGDRQDRVSVQLMELHQIRGKALMDLIGNSTKSMVLPHSFDRLGFRNI